MVNVQLLPWTVSQKQEWLTQTKWHQNQIHNELLYVCMGRIHLMWLLQLILYSCPASGCHLFVSAHTSSWPSSTARHNKERVDQDALVHANLVTLLRFDAWASAMAALTANWQASSTGGTLSLSLCLQRMLSSLVIHKLIVEFLIATMKELWRSLLHISLLCSRLHK